MASTFPDSSEENFRPPETRRGTLEEIQPLPTVSNSRSSDTTSWCQDKIESRDGTSWHHGNRRPSDERSWRNDNNRSSDGTSWRHEDSGSRDERSWRHDNSKSSYERSRGHGNSRSSDGTSWRHGNSTSSDKRSWRHGNSRSSDGTSWRHGNTTSSDERSWRHHNSRSSEERSWRHGNSRSSDGRSWRHNNSGSGDERSWRRDNKRSSEESSWRHGNSRSSIDTCWHHDLTTEEIETTGRSQRQGDPTQSSIDSLALLQELESAASQDVITRLYDARNALGMLLSKKLGDEKMKVLVYSLRNVCDSDEMPEKTGEIVSLLHEKRFLEFNLTPWIANWNMRCPSDDEFDGNISSIIFILRRMLRDVTDSVSSIGTTLLVLKSVVKEKDVDGHKVSSEVLSSLKSLNDEHETFQRDSYELTSHKKTKKYIEPPDDFRCLPILPMPHELQEGFKPFLRSNIVNGIYENVQHYLDVHFRLLREDLIHPLREGIAEFRNALTLRRDGSQGMPRVQNFSLYENVVIKAESELREGDNERESEGIRGREEDDNDYFIHFDVEGKFKSVDWELSKRLKNGSLLCLSPDNFETIIFGVIKERTKEMLEEGFVKATISDVTSTLLERPLLMVESPSYFEAYRPVLHGLQSINEDTLPFQSYLLSATTEVKLPKYVIKNPQMKLDVNYICGDKYENGGTASSFPINDVYLRDEIDWPTQDQLGFDDSQMEAYKAALTEEVCIIQGPPGTGKTFIGLKVAKTLLANKQNWSEGEPLLVICYTNHALDQFLEGILNFEKGVVRLGRRSSSAKIQARDMSSLLTYETRSIIRRLTSFKRSKFKMHAPQIQRYERIIREAEHTLLSLFALEQVLSAVHRQSLVHGCFQQNVNCILFWLFKDDDMYHISHNKRNKTFGRKKHRNLQGKEKESARNNEKQQNYQFIPESEFTEDNIPFNRNVTDGRNLFQFVQNKISQSVAMTHEEADTINDVWSLDVHQRWRLYMHWKNLFIIRMQEKLEWWREEYERLEAVRIERDMGEIRRIFRQYSVIGATTTGAAKNSALLKIIAPPIVIVEEAAEILEAHVITALSPTCQHLILIGDHQQLRPTPEVYKLCKHYKLDVSLFERLIRNGMPCHRLSTQHRMRPEISQLLKIDKEFYPGLMDHDMVTHYKDIRGLQSNLYFIKHTFTEELNHDHNSRSNRHEANFLFALYKYLLKQGYLSNQITILTAYRGQVRTFKDIMGGMFGEVRICPIDNFQGEESDIILLSFVRSNEDENIGFLKVSNRICVALSRARKGFYCIGNFDLLSTQNVLWTKIVENLRKRQCIGTHLNLVCRNHPGTFTKVSAAEDFHNVADGGCMEPCDARLNCGHTCPKKCHPENTEHLGVVCKKPCRKVMCKLQHLCPLECHKICGTECQVLCEKILKCGHQCSKKCSEPCTENCGEIVQKLLSCGHEKNVACFVNPEDVSCREKCHKRLPCGHICSQECWYPCTEGCLELIQKILPCGHKQTVPCLKKEIVCTEKCGRELPCGHSCTEKCCRSCTTKCVKIVEKVLPCGHVQKCECHVDPQNVICNAKCNKKLPCGHLCHKKCSSPCASVCMEMVPRQLPCGHSRLVECFYEGIKFSCQSNCENMLPCGHTCKKKCSQICTTKCKEIVSRTLSCGHVQETECYIKPTCQKRLRKTFQDCGHVANVLCSVKKCPEPCSKQMVCGHICKGICGKCKEDATHVKCNEPCEKRCIHSRCKKRCGDICVPCARPCTWECQHVRCGSNCSEECNRDPCNRLCRKKLPCQHQCVGFCGEPCPPVCRVCNETWIASYLGNQHKMYFSRFIYLSDCQHVVEEREMDKLMKEVSSDFMTFPECPWCMEPIRFNPRYQNKLRMIWKKIESAKISKETLKGQR